MSKLLDPKISKKFLIVGGLLMLISFPVLLIIKQWTDSAYNLTGPEIMGKSRVCREINGELDCDIKNKGDLPFLILLASGFAVFSIGAILWFLRIRQEELRKVNQVDKSEF